jgi:hypothetical protein
LESHLDESRVFDVLLQAVERYMERGQQVVHLRRLQWSLPPAAEGQKPGKSNSAGNPPLASRFSSLAIMSAWPMPG